MKEIKQTRADSLLEQVKPELEKALQTVPSFGVISLSIHFMDSHIKRVVHKRKESVILGEANKTAERAK